MAGRKISFEDYHLPGIRSGSHTIHAKLDLTLSSTKHEDHFAAPQINVQVSGPRFVFAPSEISAIFPPRDSFGEWDNVLPHIELNPSTLPWQRSSGAADDTTPWLALLLFQEDEWNDSTKVVAEKVSWEALRDELKLPHEISDRPENDGAKNDKPFFTVQALRIEETFLKKIMPTENDLSLLTHVRVGHDRHGEDRERAIVVCNRLPRKGARAMIHLISLEQHLNRDGSFDPKLATDGKVPLLSIHSWQFTCPADEQFKVSPKAIGRLEEPLKAKISQAFSTSEQRDELYRSRQSFLAAVEASGEEFKRAEMDKLINVCHIQSETFKGLMDALDFGWLKNPVRDTPSGSPSQDHSSGLQQSAKMFEAGSVPVAHGIRGGGKTVSWYHGPLIADRKFNEKLESPLRDKLPIRNGDQLLLYNQKTQMLDASYSSAWELGRLITLGDPRTSQQIAQWKTSHAREMALAEQNLWFSHIPFTDSKFVHEHGGQIEENLQKYFADLSLLHGVPFQYLIPHERMLPDESLRFFAVDQLWVDCLLDGAFSIGRTTRFDQERESSTDTRQLPPHKLTRPTLSGVLLRSDLVSGWPLLQLEAYNSDRPMEKLTDRNRLKLLRFEKLGTNVAVAIFEGSLKAFSLHLQPEALHFGFSRESAGKREYSKEVKDPATGSELDTADGRTRTTALNLGWRKEAEGLRIFVPQKIKDNLNDRLVDEEKQEGRPFHRITGSGDLAIQLLEGVPRLHVVAKN